MQKCKWSYFKLNHYFQLTEENDFQILGKNKEGQWVIKFKYSFKRSIKSDYTIEFYPLTKRYYPKYKELYLISDRRTGIIEAKGEHLFSYADFSDTEDGAKKMIELFKEQRLKKNVVTIHV